MIPLFPTLLGIFFLPTAFGRFNWTYPVAPQQCSNFTVNVTGEVVFPLTILIVPVGPSPLAHEVRKVMEVAFPTNATTVSFQLPYPTGSKFVGLVTDASGYRGDSNPWTVLSSNDSSCFDATQDFVPPFTFALSPTQISECKDVRIYWDPAKVQGITSFISVIPGGPFATIPLGNIDTQSGLGTGFTWTPAIRAKSNLIIVGGDNRGMGAGGFISVFVNAGNPNRDQTGACPASKSAAASSSSINMGAIASVFGGFFLLFAYL